MPIIRADQAAETAQNAPAAGEENDAPIFRLIDSVAQAEGQAPMPWPQDPPTFIEAVLRQHGAPEAVCRHLGEIAAAGEKTEDAVEGFAAVLRAVVSFAPWTFRAARRPLLVAGPPGSGKTHVSVKLAARFRRERVLLINTDVDSAGGIQQLEEYSRVLGFRLAHAASPDMLARVTGDRRGAATIVDCGGVNPRDRYALNRLSCFIDASIAKPLLVLPANVEAAEAVVEAKAFAERGIDRLVITRLDMVRRLGGILTAAISCPLVIAGGSFAPHFAFGLRPLTPEILARRMIASALDDRRWKVA